MESGKLMRKFRVVEGMSQQELADAVGVTRSWISRVESCHDTPSLDLLSKISEVFKIPLALLAPEKSDISPEIRSAFEKLFVQILVMKLLANK